MNNKNTIATSTKRACSDDENKGMPLAPALKRTRDEAKSANPSCVKWHQNDNPTQNPGKHQA